MQIVENDILELYLSGGGISPTTLKASEVANLIDAYENALLNVIKRDNPEIDIETIFISLVDIKEGSSRYKFIPNFKEIIFTAAVTINLAISNNTISDLPFKTVEKLSHIWKFTKK
jgi:hypothetical protein